MSEVPSDSLSCEYDASAGGGFTPPPVARQTDEAASPRNHPLTGNPMQLIGMLDSPYVRRVAVALIAAKVPFVHRPVSLFRHIDEFSKINPLLKAPTFVADGTALMDSNLILDYLASV